MLIKNYINFGTRYEIIRDGGTYKQIYSYDAPTISCSSSSELKLGLSGTFFEDNMGDIDFLTDLIRVVVIINEIEYCCGTYYVTTKTKEKRENISLVAIEAYSILYLAQRKRLEERLYIKPGELYTDVIHNLLIGSGITEIDLMASTSQFLIEREDWDIGTNHIKIINDLLKEINYNTAWVGMDGRVKITKYTPPSSANISHTYKTDEYSIISGDYSITDDVHSKCNVFKVICANLDIGSPVSAISVNDSEFSPFSIQKIGRVLQVEYIDNVPDLAVLQDRADHLKMQSFESTEEIDFTTAINPAHQVFDTIALDNFELTGIFSETDWTITLSPEADMSHRAKRVIML